MTLSDLDWLIALVLIGESNYLGNGLISLRHKLFHLEKKLIDVRERLGNSPPPPEKKERSYFCFQMEMISLIKAKLSPFSQNT